MTTKEILLKVRKLIDTPKKWIKNAFAETKDGLKVSYSNDRACKFCLSGAINRVSSKDDTNNEKIRNIVLNLCNNYFGEKLSKSCVNICNYNDLKITKHKDIMEILDKAIAASPDA